MGCERAFGGCGGLRNRDDASDCECGAAKRAEGCFLSGPHPDPRAGYREREEGADD